MGCVNLGTVRFSVPINMTSYKREMPLSGAWKVEIFITDKNLYFIKELTFEKWGLLSK